MKKLFASLFVLCLHFSYYAGNITPEIDGSKYIEYGEKFKGPDSDYGDESGHTRVSVFRDWIVDKY